MEPSPIRDNGPYTSYQQALTQFESTAFGIPGDDKTKAVLNLREALMIAGVQISDFEHNTIVHLSKIEQPAGMQVIAGWIIRAHLAGRDAVGK